MWIKNTGRCLLAAMVLSGMPGLTARGAGDSTPEKLVDVMNKLWGSHPGMRANHAKGIVLEGSFTPTPLAASLSKSPLFQGASVPLTVRFSDSTGLPTLPDGAPDANPHGMSMKFHLADGSEVDVITNSLKFFPVATGEDFLALLTALSESGPGSPKPTKADQFIGSHPAVAKAFGSTTTPSSFARETYNGIDAFVFVDKAGKRHPFRFKVVPAAGVEHLSPADAAKQPPDFLMNELPARLKTGKAVFKLMAQLADPDDQTKDPTQPWPDNRKIVQMGTITLTKVAAGNAAAQKALLFIPTNLSAGIEASDDPLIDTRAQAYAVSFGRRS